MVTISSAQADCRHPEKLFPSTDKMHLNDAIICRQEGDGTGASIPWPSNPAGRRSNPAAPSPGWVPGGLITARPEGGKEGEGRKEMHGCMDAWVLARQQGRKGG